MLFKASFAVLLAIALTAYATTIPDGTAAVTQAGVNEELPARDVEVVARAFPGLPGPHFPQGGLKKRGSFLPFGPHLPQGGLKRTELGEGDTKAKNGNPSEAPKYIVPVYSGHDTREDKGVSGREEELFLPDTGEARSDALMGPKFTRTYVYPDVSSAKVTSNHGFE